LTAPPPEPAAGLRHLLDAALDAVDARAAVVRALSSPDGGPPVVESASARPVLAIGKAAGVMLDALGDVPGVRVGSALVVTKAGPSGGPRPGVEWLEGAHPLPDARSEAAGRRVLEWVAALDPEESLLVLLSGGASALTTCPAAGLQQSDLHATNAALMDAGADIESLNVVRKHLSAIAGGRLARAAGCGRIEVLAVSDVPGDRLDVIGSGLFSGDPSSYADALGVVERCALRARLPAAVIAHLEAGRAGRHSETPDPGDGLLARVHSRVVACNGDAREAAAQAARALGVRPVMLGEVLAGEARIVGARLAALARALVCPAPTVLIAGGETVVRVTGPGRGGRNQELALAAALELARAADPRRDAPGPALLAAGSDGQDGPTDLAGAIVDVRTVGRAADRGLDALALLDANDAYAFFAEAGGGLRTPVGRTNVMDLAMLWLPESGVD
jgi:glycerate-2-kinase